MKNEILKAKFKVFRENVDTTMYNIEKFCEVSGVTYTYSVKHKFWPMKSVVTIEFEGPKEYVEMVEIYLENAHGIS